MNTGNSLRSIVDEMLKYRNVLNKARTLRKFIT